MSQPESWHLTVLFLGSQPRDVLPMIREATSLVAASIPRFQLTAGDLGAPGRLDRPRLVWLTCDDGGVLARAQQQLLERLGDLRVEATPFRAHVTLGRARRPSRIAFKEVISQVNEGERPSPVTVDRLVLYRSHLERSGARYEALLECDLECGE
jgi:2'-5' RNA ligase